MTPQELKNSILQLAIQGKLVEQRPEEGTATELLEKILAAKDAKGRGNKLTRRRGVCEENKTSALSASPREEIPDDEKNFDIPESWEWVRLESIVNSVPSKQYQILESEVRTSGKFAVISQSKEYSIGFTDISEKVYHHVNPVIVFGDHTTEVKYVEFDFVVGADGVKIFEPLDGLLLAKYLFYVLLFNTYDLSKVGGYSRHYKFLKNKPIPLPPLAEQKRIVAKIEELMPLVDRYEKAWSRLKDFNKRFPIDMQKSLLQMAIQGKLVEQKADEGTGAELLEKILAAKNAKDAKGKGEKYHAKSAKSAKVGSRVSREEIPDDEKPFDIPESWEWVRLGEIFVTSSGTTPLKSNADYYSNQDYNWVRTTDLNNGILTSCEIKISQKAFEECRLSVIPIDSVCVAMYGGAGTIGKNAIIRFDTTINQSVCAIQPNGFCDMSFVQKFLQVYRPFWMKMAAGSRKDPNINQVIIKNALFPLPPLAEQKRIVAKLEELLPLCERLKSESNSAANS